MTNRYRPHVYVIPEDDANRQIANGFGLDDRLRHRAFQVMPPAGGWRKVIEKIRTDYLKKLQSNNHLRVVGMVDCDHRQDRIAEELGKLPEDVRDRVFLLGALSDPERFKSSAGMSFEELGKSLADECGRDHFELWHHEELGHLRDEIQQAKKALRPILFDVGY